MKNETLQQLLKRTVGENLLKVTFVKPEGNDTLYTKDGLLKMMNTDNQIKVQSVALPLNYQLFSLKTEEQFLDWMQNKIHNVHSAFFDFNNKYKENAEQVSWNNNKMQNQRYLETSGR